MMYGSFVNRIMESGRIVDDTKIVVGLGATVCHYSDRGPVTVVAVLRGKDGRVTEIYTQGDHVGPNKLVWPAQDYDITPVDPEGTEYAWIDGVLRRRLPLASGWDPTPLRVQTWRVDRNGRLRSTYVNENGRRVMSPKNGGSGLALGSRDYYQDPSF